MIILLWVISSSKNQYLTNCLLWQRPLSMAVDCRTVALVERLSYRWGSGEPTVNDVLPVIQTLWDWRLQRLKEQKKHAGVRLNKALSTPASLGTTKGKAAPLNPLRIQTSAQSRRQVNHLKSSDYTVTHIISAVYSLRKWWTPCHFKDVLICHISACLK